MEGAGSSGAGRPAAIREAFLQSGGKRALGVCAAKKYLFYFLCPAMVVAERGEKRGEGKASRAHAEIAKVVKDALREQKADEEAGGEIETREIAKESILVTLVVVPDGVYGALKKSIRSVVEKLEQKVGGTVFVVRKKVDSGLVRGERRHRTGPTHRDYQEAVAKDLVAPSHIVDRRTLVREDGSRLEKVMVDRKDKEELEHRFEPMGVVFEALFEKRACFQANYY